MTKRHAKLSDLAVNMGENKVLGENVSECVGRRLVPSERDNTMRKSPDEIEW